MNMSFNLEMEGLQIAENHTIEQAKKVLWLSMHKMEQLAKRFAPVDTGLLRRSINLHPIQEGATEYVLADGVKYGEYVEYGTSPHLIRPKNKQALSFEWTEFSGKMLSKKGRREAQAKRGASISPDKVVFKIVKHPGTNAHPFFRPAKLEVERVWLKKYWARVMAQAE